MPSKEVSRARASVAALKRHHPDQADRVVNAVAELKAAKAADYIRELVDAAPPLTPDQRMRLAALLVTPHAGREHAA